MDCEDKVETFTTQDYIEIEKKGKETTSTKQNHCVKYFHQENKERENVGKACFKAKCLSIKSLVVEQTQNKTETHQAQVTMSMKMKKQKGRNLNSPSFKWRACE